MGNALPSVIRIVAAALYLVLAAPLLTAQAYAQGLDGTFLGMDGAQGITISLSQGGRGYVGEINAAGGGRADINAALNGEEAEGPLVLQGRSGTMRLSPRPVGLSMVWTPDDGGTQLVYAFRRQSVQLPSPPAGFVQPPAPGEKRINPIGFLHSYEFWDPNDVARAYDLMEDKYRVIMRTFPAVHGDILWKLCQAGRAPVSLGDALRGQNITCGSLNAKLRESQKTGGFGRFKRRVGLEKQDALLAVECARGIHTAQICRDAASRTQRAATSIVTLTSILDGL